MRCDDALPLLHDLHDERIDPAQRDALRAHVAACAACARADAQLRALRAAFRATPPVRAPAGFADAVMDALPRARLLSLPRILFPIGAVAALLVSAVVVAQFAERDEIVTARGFTDAAPPAAPELTEGDGDRARRSSGFAAGEAAETGPSHDKELEDAEPAAAAAPAPSAPPGVGAPPAPPETAAMPGQPQAPGARAPGVPEAADAAKADAAAPVPDVRVVVFRTKDEAAAFLGALVQERLDRTKRSADAPAGGGGGGAPPASGGGGGAPAPATAKRAAAPKDAGALAQAAGPAPFASITVATPAWTEALRKHGGRLVDPAAVAASAPMRDAVATARGDRSDAEDAKEKAPAKSRGAAPDRVSGPPPAADPKDVPKEAPPGGEPAAQKPGAARDDERRRDASAQSAAEILLVIVVDPTAPRGE